MRQASVHTAIMIVYCQRTIIIYLCINPLVHTAVIILLPKQHRNIFRHQARANTTIMTLLSNQAHDRFMHQALVHKSAQATS